MLPPLFPSDTEAVGASSRERTISDFDTRRARDSASMDAANRAGNLTVNDFTIPIVRQWRQICKTLIPTFRAKEKVRRPFL
jgi:hypothetical protein